MLEPHNLEYKIVGATEPAVPNEMPPREAVGIERKDMTPSLDAEIRTALDDLMVAFEDFKDSNDERLAAIEKRSGVDVLTEEKTARLNARLDQQQRIVDQLAARWRSGHAGSGASTDAGAHKSAFEAFLRAGNEAPLLELKSERKALSIGSDTDGGYLVPDEVERRMTRTLTVASPIRAIARVQAISTSALRRSLMIDGAGAGWVGEAASRIETASPRLAELAFPTMELYAMPAASTTLLDDAVVDIEAWLADEIGTAFAEQEGAAFVFGDGVAQPKGFLTGALVDDTAWSWGALGALNTGANGDFAVEEPADALLDLVFALKSGYRAEARFVMNGLTHAAVRKLKDGHGSYLWQPGTGTSAPTLMGYPVTEAEDMPAIAPDAPAVAFGDFKRGYLIVDRLGVRIMRDPYSAKPYVMFYATKRVGGGIQDYA